MDSGRRSKSSVNTNGHDSGTGRSTIRSKRRGLIDGAKSQGKMMNKYNAKETNGTWTLGHVYESVIRRKQLQMDSGRRSKSSVNTNGQDSGTGQSTIRSKRRGLIDGAKSQALTLRRSNSNEDIKQLDVISKGFASVSDEQSTNRSLPLDENGLIRVARRGLKKKTRRGSLNRYIEEKRIFQELADLKRMQIQYGNVQEQVLVQKLMDGYFSSFRQLKTGDFQRMTFHAWEKFLYDRLKYLYLQERNELLQQNKDVSHVNMTNLRIPTAYRSRNSANLFESKLRRLPTYRSNDPRFDRLVKIYGVAPIPLQYSRNI